MRSATCFAAAASSIARCASIRTCSTGADLPARERSQALAELGQDYLKGGLLDRAEDAFTRLLEDRDHRFDALRSLLRIFQMEREWLKAIDCARRLEREAGENHQVAIAHYHCELADVALEARRGSTTRSAPLTMRWRRIASRCAR